MDEDEDEAAYFSRILSQAREILLEDSSREASRQRLGDQRAAFEDGGEAARLRWFLLPSEAKEMLQRRDGRGGGEVGRCHRCPP